MKGSILLRVSHKHAAPVAWLARLPRPLRLAIYQWATSDAALVAGSERLTAWFLAQWVLATRDRASNVRMAIMARAA